MLSGNSAQIDMSRPVVKNLTTCPALRILYNDEFVCGLS